MEIEIVSKLNSKPEIQAGDIFEHDKHGFYILTRSDNGECNLSAISGDIVWDIYSSLEWAASRITKNMTDGRLKHYPKSKWKLQLVETGNGER